MDLSVPMAAKGWRAAATAMALVSAGAFSASAAAQDDRDLPLRVAPEWISLDDLEGEDGLNVCLDRFSVVRWDDGFILFEWALSREINRIGTGTYCLDVLERAFVGVDCSIDRSEATIVLVSETDDRELERAVRVALRPGDLGLALVDRVCRRDY